MRLLSSPTFRLLCLLLGLLSLPALAADKPTLAVFYFGYGGKNPDMEVFKKALSQMLITDLGGLGAMTVVERERLQEILDEQNLGQSGKIDQSTAVKIGRLLGAHYMVVGSYFDWANQLVIDARVVDIEKGVAIGRRVTGSPDEFLALEQKLSQDIHQVLEGIVSSRQEKSPSPAPGPSGSGTTSPARAARKLPLKTALRYSRALDAKDRKDVETAKKELKAVLEEQPDFLLASNDLARLMK